MGNQESKSPGTTGAPGLYVFKKTEDYLIKRSENGYL